jgi:hypothetical protein
VRAEIAKELAKLGSETARQALLDALGDQHPKARRALVDALGELRHETVGDAMVKIIDEGGVVEWRPRHDRLGQSLECDLANRGEDVATAAPRGTTTCGCPPRSASEGRSR